MFFFSDWRCFHCDCHVNVRQTETETTRWKRRNSMRLYGQERDAQRQSTGSNCAAPGAICCKCVCGRERRRGEETGFNDGSPKRLLSAKETCSSAPESMIILNRFFPDSPDWVPDLLHTDIAHTCCISFFFFTRIVRFHLNCPSVGVRTLSRLTNLTQVSSFCTATAAFISMRTIRSSMADLSTATALVGVVTAFTAFTAALATAARGI